MGTYAARSRTPVQGVWALWALEQSREQVWTRQRGQVYRGSWARQTEHSEAGPEVRDALDGPETLMEKTGLVSPSGSGTQRWANALVAADWTWYGQNIGQTGEGTRAEKKGIVDRTRRVLNAGGLVGPVGNDLKLLSECVT